MGTHNVNNYNITDKDLINYRESFVNTKTNKTYTQSEFAEILGVKRSTYAAYETGRNKINAGHVEILENIFKKDIPKSNIGGEIREDGNKRGTKTPTKTGIEYENEIALLKKSNQSIIEAHLLVAKSNNELVTMLKSTDGADLNTWLIFDSKFSDLLELIAEVGSGKKWLSKQEAAAELSKRFHGKKGGK